MRKHNQGGTATDLAPVMGARFLCLKALAKGPPCAQGELSAKLTEGIRTQQISEAL